MLRLLQAGWLLAWSLLRTLALRLLRPSRDELALFQRYYRPDRLLPLTTEDRLLLPNVSGCLGCGRCDVGQGPNVAASGGRYRGMMAFMLSASRSIPDFDASADALRAVSDEELDALQTRCPADIPFRRLASFIRHKADQMGTA